MYMSQALAWICLALVASTTAYGLQRTAAAIMPSAGASDLVTSATLTRHVLIIAVDHVTGDRAQLDCDVPTNVTSDVIVVDASVFADVARVCDDDPNAFGVRP
jgi:hypothetical protein